VPGWNRSPSRNLLVLAHRLPYPPDRGCRIRAYHLLAELANHHRVHLLSFADVGQQPRTWSPLRDLCATLEVVPLPRASAYARTALRSGYDQPLTLSYFRSRRMLRAVQQHPARAEISAIVAFSTAMAPYALALDLPAVLDMVDVDSAKWAQAARLGHPIMRPVYALEARRVRAYETEMADRFPAITLATDRERELLLTFAPQAPALTVRNGVEVRPAPPPRPAPHASLLFVGQMDYLPNVDAVVSFAHRVFPRLRREFPDLELCIAGRNPVAVVRRLEALPGVVVTGEVADIGSHLARAWVSVAPVQIACGVQNKVLEAMAAGVPVVASAAVVAGLADSGVRDGEELLSAADDQAMGDAVARLLRSPAERRRLGAAGRERVHLTCDWQRAGAEMLDILEDTVRLATGPGEIAGSPAGARRAGAG
jgi:sugar transferase (PEP-CTERM/EpsH1 system associated)